MESTVRSLDNSPDGFEVDAGCPGATSTDSLQIDDLLRESTYIINFQVTEETRVHMLDSSRARDRNGASHADVSTEVSIFVQDFS